MREPSHSGTDEPDGIAQGRLGRSAPVAGLAGETLVRALKARVTGGDAALLHGATAERYAELLGHSKGALMKAGQAISFVSLGAAVAPEFQTAYRTALGRLRAEAPPMRSELAREVLERELGRPAGEAFAEFCWEPIAAASIGQVHEARLHDGRAVAVKIQYPGVAAAIRSDLRNAELLATFLRLLCAIAPRRVRLDFPGIAREMEARITEELDYRLEARNQAMFAQLYRGHPFIHVPEVMGELCTERVLTQELVQGIHWRESLEAPQDLRSRWAEAINRFCYGSYHRFCIFHADPHPGNYIFHADGRVSFLDFGCVKQLEREEIDQVNGIVRACLAGDVLGTWERCVEIGWFSSKARARDVYEYWREPYELYWGDQPFTVTPEYMSAWVTRRYSPAGPSADAFRYITQPGKHALLPRLEIGSMSVIGELRASNPWGSIAAEYFENAPAETAFGKLDQAFFATPSRER